MLYPRHFIPFFQGNASGVARNLERLYRQTPAPGVPIGESWEIQRPPG